MIAGGLLQRVEASAARQGNRCAVSQAGARSLTYADLLARVRRASCALVELGAQPGDRVLFGVRPGADAVVLLLAILRAGGVIAPLDLGMGDETFAARRALIDPRWMVAESIGYALSAHGWMRRVLRARGVALPPLARMTGVQMVRVGRRWPGVPQSIDARALWRASEPAREHAPIVHRGPAEAAVIVCTSGTTGAPKAVVHSTASLVAMMHGIAAHLCLTADDVVYAREMHMIIPALLAGARVVVPPRGRPSPARTLRSLVATRSTHASFVADEAHELVACCERQRRRLPATLRLMLLSSAPSHAPFLSRLRGVLADSTRVLSVYGMTEILPVAVASLEEKLAFDGRGDLAGALVADVQARVADDGELYLRGPALCTGYLGMPALREHATGDLARIDERGRIVLLGRKKDMIIRDGFNIYPELYESTIEGVPGVRRCALVGWYDESAADERVALVVEALPGTDERALEQRLHRALRSGPSRIDEAALPDEIVFAPLPLAGRSSKVDKHALRAQLERRVACASR
jgi:long-chain acyl-CoA synthetase